MIDASQYTLPEAGLILDVQNAEVHDRQVKHENGNVELQLQLPRAAGPGAHRYSHAAGARVSRARALGTVFKVLDKYMHGSRDRYIYSDPFQSIMIHSDPF